MEGVCWEKRRAMTASVVSRPVLLTAYVIEAFFWRDLKNAGGIKKRT